MDASSEWVTFSNTTLREAMLNKCNAVSHCRLGFFDLVSLSIAREMEGCFRIRTDKHGQ
jgi:hypothetical protein